MADPEIGAVAELKRYAADDAGTQSYLTKAEAKALLKLIDGWQKLAARQLDEFAVTTQRYRYALQEITQLRQSDNPAADLAREADKIARAALAGDTE